MPEDEEETGRRRDAAVFSVAPARSRHLVPRGALVALVVGVFAFIGGIAVASTSPASRPQPGRTQAPAAAASSTAAPAATAAAPAPVIDGGPGTGPGDATSGTDAVSRSSGFAARFAPGPLVAGLPDGTQCVTGEPRTKEVPRTRLDGPRLTSQRSWLIWCPVPEAQRQTFLLALFDRLVEQVPAETYGFSTSQAGAGDALFPYAETPFAGTVAVTADAAGPGLSIAVVLQEWRSR